MLCYRFEWAVDPLYTVRHSRENERIKLKTRSRELVTCPSQLARHCAISHHENNYPQVCKRARAPDMKTARLIFLNDIHQNEREASSLLRSPSSFPWSTC